MPLPRSRTLPGPLPGTATGPHQRHALLHSVSLSALVVAAAAPAQAAPFRTLAQALGSHASAPITAAQTAGGATAANAAGLGAQNMAAAAARFTNLNAALASAANGYTGPAVPNGVVPGGLQQGTGVTAGGTQSVLWSGASTTLGTQTVNGVQDVTVTQTRSVADLTWKTFNVGAKTRLSFNQSAGGTLANTWIAINSVQDPLANPSVILGQISAPGKVYILNRNGVLFGAGSQVNVGSLIAATADIAQAQFTRDANGLVESFSLYGSQVGTTTAGSFTQTFINPSTSGSIIVDAGATIVTPAPAANSTGGYVMLLGATVRNDGIIATPQGQTVLAAGNNFVLQPGFSTTGSVTATVIGSQVAAENNAGSITGTGTTALGAATNTGIIMADQGDITMVGHLVTQAGILLSTTTVNQRGSVHLLTDRTDTTASIVLAPGSITEVLPEDNGATALNSQRASNISNSASYNVLRAATLIGPSLNDTNTLPDEIGESRIEISSGGTVLVQNGALALAQGGQVAVGGSNIVLDTGARVDVSGTNANLPASFNELFVQGIVPYYLRDSAANRTGGLEFSNVYIDERTLVEIAANAYAGNIYTQGGLLEVSGNLGLIPHGIEEWSAIGGQVTLQGAANGGYVTAFGYLPGTVTVSSGATINLTGGTTTFGSGLVKQSYVITNTGVIYNINSAPANLVYAGVYTGTVVDHKRWQITDTYVNPLLTPAEIYQPEYTIGHDAGTLTVTAGTAAMNGTVLAGVTVGASQVSARPASVSDPFTLAQTVTPLAGALLVGDYVGGAFNIPFDSDILVGNGSSGGSNKPVVTALPDSVTGTISIGAAALSEAGFASVTFSTAGDITVAAPITLAAGGTLVLSANTIEADAGITAQSGKVVLTNLYPGSTIGNQAGSGAGSITLAPGATIDTSGEWTNLVLAANNTLGAGYANGGSVTIIGTGGVDLAAGSTIDVSSGGVLSTTGKLQAASGGNISVSADIVPTQANTLQSGGVTYASRFIGFASGTTSALNAGTLSLAAPDIVLGTAPSDAGSTTVAIGAGLFADGFADYALTGYAGVTVDPDLQLNITRAVYALNDPTVATLQPARDALSIILPPLFTQVKGGDTLAQRAGASLSLSSSIYTGVYNGGGGTLTMGAGAHITVDPKQSISLDAYGQLTDLGTLTAHGGTITLANSRYDATNEGAGNGNLTNYIGSLSVWIGAGAVVDASGEATIFTDAQGRRFGQAQSGGTILLGGLGGLDAASVESTYAQVILRPGAVLNVTGADATVDASAGLTANSVISFAGPITLSGNGGEIAARSYSGVALDGTMLAQGAGAGAAGGTLSMRLDPQALDQFYGVPQSYIAPSQIIISQDTIPVQTQPGLAPGDATDPATIGLGRVSQQQINAGGFDSLVLYAQDDITFRGDVSLQLGRSISLDSAIIGENRPNGSASITAPYVSLTGYSSGDVNALGSAATLQYPAATTATLSVNADLIDFANDLSLGGFLPLPQVAQSSGGSVTGTILYASTYGFETTNFNSTGDIRFTEGTTAGTLASSGNITFRAGQLYPTTSGPDSITSFTVQAGLFPPAESQNGVNLLAGGTLTVLRQPGATPPPPLSLGGTLALIADTVVQDGVVRAPEGLVELGQARTSGDSTLQLTSTVTLGPDSITSVSLDGQTVPYGGTVDGVNYLYQGNPVVTFSPVVAISATTFTADPGSVIDLRGGGTIAGAGFIAGRGGSADVNKTPLLNTSSGTVTANGSDPVFAIVPGYSAGYAPEAPVDSAYSTPGEGAQITISAGEVAGLAAGTYTLLPAYYDLLPGAFRVELTTATAAPGSTQAWGNFTTIAAVTLGTANTGFTASTPVAALLTSANGVRQLSQYDEENYSSFETTSSATFDAPRPLLPQDAKTLDLTLNTPTGTIATTSAISIGPDTLLQAPAAGGYGATLEISARGNDNGPAAIEVLGPGDAATQLLSSDGTTALPTLAIDAATLSALDVPRLVIGGTLTTIATTPNEITVVGIDSAVVIEPHADLTAGDVLLTATSAAGTITVSGGATISTLGENNSAYGVAQGYYFNTDTAGVAAPVLEVSSNQVVYTPNQFAAPGAVITVDDGATLAAGGSLNFVGPSGTSVQVGQAGLSAKYISLQVADINIGSAANLAAFAAGLPAGLTLTDTAFNTLAQGASELILTAQQAVNAIGSVTLDSGTTNLELNTPAIYGYGISTNGAAPSGSDTGIVTISAPSVTWGGVGVNSALQNGGVTVLSATPGGRLAGSVTEGGATLTLTGAQALDISAKTIDLGFGPDQRVNDQVNLGRLALGFGAVTLQASSEITANNQSSLTVYATQAQFGQPGAGGNLTLSSPLITAASGAVLDLTAGGILTANAGTAKAAATGTITTLGAQIDLTAAAIDTSTAFALPSGIMAITSQGDIDLAAGTNIDLSGRATKLFDQTAESPGGTLTLEAYASNAGSITEASGAAINVGAPGASAGGVSATASGGTVAFNGTLDGAATAGHSGGSFTVFAGTLASGGFDGLVAALASGGFTGSQNFEVATGDIAVDQAIAAHHVSITADAGSIDVAATIDASGATPGSIALSAGTNLTLESSAVLDAHAADMAVDSYGEPINADNRAHVTLTSAAGTVTLSPGATIDVAYDPGSAAAAADPQGQVVINAPRVTSGGLEDVAVSAPGSLNITGAASIDLFAFRTYTPSDPNGTIVQDNTSSGAPAGAVGIVQIGQDNTAFMTQVNTDAVSGTLTAQLAGLVQYGKSFNLLPGVDITSSAASSGNLTISGDLDFSGLRYSDPAAFGISQNGTTGSGEPGAIVFRASNDLTVNGSVSDGFLPPPDSTNGTNLLPGDTNGWEFITSPHGGYEATEADVLLPSTAEAVFIAGNGNETMSPQVYLVGSHTEGDAGTFFDTTRPISLNYAITIDPARLRTNVAIPFVVNVGANSLPVPAGGWVATASVTRGGVVIYQAGQLIPAGFNFLKGDVLGAGFVLPVTVITAPYKTGPHGVVLSEQIIPAFTPFSVFQATSIELATDVELPVNAFIPAHTRALFGSYFTIKGKTVFKDVTEVAYRETQSISGNDVQGYLYPLAQMLAPGSLSWSMEFVAGADLASANQATVLAASTLNGGVFTPAPTAQDQTPGSLLIEDQHYYGKPDAVDVAFSVIRTGTGDLSLIAGGNVDQSSLYGIYTAGTQDVLPTGNAQFNSARYNEGGDTLLPGDPTVSALISATYQAYYPNDGGDFLLSAQGNVTSDVFADGNGATTSPTDNVGNWLWRQGSTQLGQPTAWWINFGTLVAPLGESTTPSDGSKVAMTGFTGFGALGGGNVTVDIGGNAGQLTARDASNGSGLAYYRGEGLVIAAGGTGRLLPGTSTPVTTGGGNVTIDIGGALNPIDQAAYGIGATPGSGGLSGQPASVNGDVIDLRGDIAITAAAIGRIDYQYDSGTSNQYDPRAGDPFSFDNGVPNGGIQLVPGDGTVSITTDRDLVLGGATDPGRVYEQSVTSLAQYASQLGTTYTDNGGFTGFTLWQPDTSISLFSSGGNVTPTTLPNQSTISQIQNDLPTDYRSIYPSTLLVTAATGDIIYGQDGAQPNTMLGYTQYSLETMPSANGQVAFLAGNSIIANGYAVDISGANPAALSLPTNPAFTSDGSAATGLTNIRVGTGTYQSPIALFAEEADTPTTNLHAGDPNAALFYAAGGDIVNFDTGETLYFGSSSNEPQSSWYIAAKPVRIIAENDIVSTGTRPDAYPNAATFAEQENQQLDSFTTVIGNALTYYSSGNLFFNNSATSLSEIMAGRDILSAYAYVGGQGALDVSAGRNLYQAAYTLGPNQELFFGSLKSLGDNLITGSTLNTSAGASINVDAGVGAAGPDFAAFAALYFNTANQYSFDGNFPTPAVPAGSDTYSYGKKVQFGYATSLLYSNLQTALAEIKSGTPVFFRPSGATSGGSGVLVPSALLTLLKDIEASAAPLPKNQDFSFLQVLLWYYTGYRGTAANAPTAYAALPSDTADFLARTAFYMELQASGADHSNAASTFYNSYVRGQEAIDTVFPSFKPEAKSPSNPNGAPGVPAGYTGAITMYSGTVTANGKIIDAADGTAATFDGGVATLFGGSVQVLDPGGASVFGITGGPAPGNSSGIVTYGSGDINIYALNNVLLGQSRIFTAGGGNITIWSSDGDINAGIGAKTTVVYNPPVLIYDDEGDITDTPPASTSGAGIATLQPLPDVPAGDVSLIAPGGTIDAGEAGIRVSGNLALAAARVVGTANISVKGSTSGAPSVSVASLGAVEAAGAAAGAAASTAQSQGQKGDTAEAASVIEVEVISIGGTYDAEKKRRKTGI